MFRDRNRVVDVCCGTGALFPILGDRLSAGLDFTHAMLRRARERHPSARVAEGDAQKMPFHSSFFDAALIVYSIRNIPDVPAALSELHRVLVPSGLLGILDFGIPTGEFGKKLYLLYFQKLLPLLGSWVAKDPASYRYFVDSVLRFPKRNAFLEIMRSAGFAECRCVEFTFGAALCYLAKKPNTEDQKYKRRADPRSARPSLVSNTFFLFS